MGGGRKSLTNSPSDVYLASVITNPSQQHPTPASAGEPGGEGRGLLGCLCSLFRSLWSKLRALKFSLFTVIPWRKWIYSTLPFQIWSNKYICMSKKFIGLPTISFFVYFSLQFCLFVIVEETGCSSWGFQQFGFCWLWCCLMCSSAIVSCKLVVRFRGLIRFRFNYFVKNISHAVFCTSIRRYKMPDCLFLVMWAAIGGHCPDSLIH